MDISYEKYIFEILAKYNQILQENNLMRKSKHLTASTPDAKFPKGQS